MSIVDAYRANVVDFRDDNGTLWRVAHDESGNMEEWILRPPACGTNTTEARVIAAWNPRSERYFRRRTGSAMPLSEEINVAGC